MPGSPRWRHHRALKLQIETAGHAQTKWLMATILTTAGLSIATLMSLLHLFPPH